jgi:hypothetical protein
MNDKELKVKEMLTIGAQKTISEFFENEKDNKMVQLLLGKMNSGYFNLKESIEYGLSQITKDEETQKLLSSYFFLLSELKDIDDKVRDFVLDVSVWSEGASEYSQYYKDIDLLSIYDKEIKSLFK